MSIVFDPTKSLHENKTEFERQYIVWLLDRHDGNISAASRESRTDRKWLYELALRHGVRVKKGRYRTCTKAEALANPGQSQARLWQPAIEAWTDWRPFGYFSYANTTNKFEFRTTVV